MDVTVKLRVNGRAHTVTTDAQRSLLDVLREELGITGPKYGCGEGRCGACTVLLEDRPVHACVTTIAKADQKSITTIEGLTQGNTLHPVQQAFIDEGAVQCGYCTGGMILAAVALLERNAQPTDRQIVEGMNDHICRCNGYAKIVRAVRRAAQAKRGGDS